MNTPHRQHWDIFCRVIDNFGDVGVSWRLARQLASEHGATVRLWVDRMASLQVLCPQVQVDVLRQVVEGVVIFRYADDMEYPAPADVVIEAFGCGLPQTYVAAMAACKAKPLWIILEYLSAEPWVREHHGLPSPHPQLGLPRYFFFPGFTEGTGGVLCEAGLLARRDAFDAKAKHRWWSRRGFAEVPQDVMTVSLFSYPHAPYQALLDACANGTLQVVVAIPEGPLALQVRDTVHTGTANRYRTGNLELRFVPFVPQVEYDDLLWVSDINFVRGEDSFVRAQWAGRPFVWHIYPQQENTHVPKLDAFLSLFSDGLPSPAAQAVYGLWNAWNGVKGAPIIADAWYAFNDVLPEQRQRLRHWNRQLAQIGDVTGNLVKFCQKLI